MDRAQHLAEKALCRLSIPGCTQQKIERMALGIHGTIAVVPLLFDFDIYLINTLGISGRFQL
jgi:hypothetical protein